MDHSDLFGGRAWARQGIKQTLFGKRRFGRWRRGENRPGNVGYEGVHVVLAIVGARMLSGGDEDHCRHNVDQSVDRMHPSARIRETSEITDFGVGEFAHPGLKFEVAEDIGVATIEFPNYGAD